MRPSPCPWPCLLASKPGPRERIPRTHGRQQACFIPRVELSSAQQWGGGVLTLPCSPVTTHSLALHSCPWLPAPSQAPQRLERLCYRQPRALAHPGAGFVQVAPSGVMLVLGPTLCNPMDCSLPDSSISPSLLKLMSIESVMASNHLILCYSFFLLSSIFPSIRVFSNELALPIRWPKY